MSKRRWVEWDEQCPECGDSVDVLTSAPQEEEGEPQCFDSDRWKCHEGHEGHTSVDEKGIAYLGDCE